MNINLAKGVFIRTRLDGKLFNLARLKASSKTREVCIRELLFADDSALVANSLEDIQEITHRFAAAASQFGLKINTNKTELLYQPPLSINNPQQPVVEANGEILKCTDSFTYLGSTVTSNNSSDAEIDKRISAASKAFGALISRLWSRHDIKLQTKIKIYNATVLPSLLYGTETMTLYRRHIKLLTRTQLRHLRQIMKVKWQDKIPDTQVLQQAGTISVEAVITASQLRWAGHVIRMSEDRIPKLVFYSELDKGKRKRGGQRLRFKDVIKRHLKTAAVDTDTWEDEAMNRIAWRGVVHRSKKAVEQQRLESYNRAHERRHNQSSTTTADINICPRCGRICRSRAGLAAHARACKI